MITLYTQAEEFELISYHVSVSLSGYEIFCSTAGVVLVVNV
jgi:hypothetical protein